MPRTATTPESFDVHAALGTDVPAGVTAESEPGTIRDSNPGASRFRRRMERFRGTESETAGFEDGFDDEAELKLQLMLLREENARLKSARHQPSSPGTAIDRVRVLATSANEGEALDDAFSLLGDVLTIRESLDQVCVEIQSALDSVRQRLDTIVTQVGVTMAESQDAAGLTA
jgi:hypothetical protein